MRNLICLAVFAWCISGCGKRVIPDELERDINSLPGCYKAGWSGERFCEHLRRRIDENTNAVVRFASYKLLWDTLYDLKVNGEDRRLAAILINSVNDNLEIANYCLFKNGLPREKTLANIVERFRWMKAQGDRLRPTHRIDYSELVPEERRKYDQWRGSYMACRGHYEERLYMFEKYFAMDVALDVAFEVTSEERASLRRQMEALIGRPLRTLAQLKAMRHLESDVVKAVKRKEVGPACFARKSDPPVSFPSLEMPSYESTNVVLKATPGI